MKSKIAFMIIFFFCSIIFSNQADAQKLVIDPVMAGIATANAIIENNSYDKIKDNQKAIEKLQAATVVTTEFINKWQRKIYDGLLYVSSTVNNAYQVYDAARILANIYDLEKKTMQEARKEPLALIFAVKYQREMILHAIEYYIQIHQLILKTGDEKLLMNAGERTLLLNQVLESLRVIESYAVSSYYKVRYAVMNGILKTLNPFGNFVNRDARIVKDILGRWKY